MITTTSYLTIHQHLFQMLINQQNLVLVYFTFYCARVLLSEIMQYAK